MKRTIEVGEPDWKPLEGVLSPADCADFMYMASAGGIVLYKHRDTRMYLNIDAATGRFYRYAGGDYVEISREEAIQYVYGTTE
jgi:hypothetical protein